MSRLSVIVPGYRTPHEWWQRCLASVRRAIGPEDEIICVDDGDPNGVFFLDEEARCDDRIHVLHCRNAGPAAARNEALAVSTGAWVTFVDSDDEVISGVYDKILHECVSCQADIGVFGVRVIWVADGLFKEDVPETHNHGIIAPVEVRRLSNQRLLNYVWNKVYRRGFLNENRICFPSRGMTGEDVSFNIECLLASARWCTLDGVGYIYHRTGGTVLSSYRPYNIEGMRFEVSCWKAYVETVPEQALLFKFLTEKRESDYLWAEWENIWRLRSPYSLGERLRFLRDNRAQMIQAGGGWQRRALRISSLFLMLLRLLYQALRRWAYVRLLRRWHIRCHYPDAMDVRLLGRAGR